MTCLIKSKNKPLLNEYTDMLGSETAAYYVLCKNNGYPLEFTPMGEKSDLFLQLLVKNNYDYEAAILEKASMYYSSYYDNIGGDWTMMGIKGGLVDEKGEPKIDFKPSSIDFSDVFEQPILLDESDTMSMVEIQKNIIENDLDIFLQEAAPQSMSERVSKSEEWLADRQKKLVKSINKDLIAAFGLEKHTDDKGNVYFTSKEKDENGRYKLVIQFCEYIENGKKGVYDQTGRIEAAANVIQISLTDSDPSTINHELAHHYVRMFWDSDVVQNAVQKIDDGDRSEGWQVRLEEKLVDEITKRTSTAEDFWGKFSDAIKSVFLWISSPIKQNLLRKASLAFRFNNQAVSIRKEGYIVSFIDPFVKRVYANGSPNVLIYDFDQLFQNDINQAITKYVKDSIKFFVDYTANPNSILKDEYDAYTQHVKNALCGTEVSDADFNVIFIYIHDQQEKLITANPDPNSGENKAAIAMMSMISEAKAMRNNLRNNNVSAVAASTGNVAAPEIDGLIDAIMRGLRTRKYEYQRTVPKDAQKANAVQELIEKLLSIRENSDKLTQFLEYGTLELALILRQLEKDQINGFADITPQQLLSLWNTISGFYIPSIDVIADHPDITIIESGILYPISVLLSNMKNLCWSIGKKLAKANKTIIRNTTHEFLVGKEDDTDTGAVGDLLTDEQKERFLENFDDQLIIGKLFEDINMLQPYIGLASRSRSLVIRVARNMILSANAEIRRASLKDAARIVKLYFQALPEMRKLGLKEILSVFLEIDENGKRTGYFVRKLNWGKFYNKMNENRDRLINEANDKLRKALGENAPQITYDEHNAPVLPQDDDPIVKNILTEYDDALDEWLCEHGERMFTADYYRTRRSKLSPTTRKVMLDLQSRMNAIRSKAPILKVENANGQSSTVYATWELSPQDQLNLVQLQMEYQQLGNLYYSDGTAKSGPELKIAQEISDFNEWKAKLISYKQNEEKFEACILKIRDKYGNNSEQESRFRKLNTSIIVNPAYYEWVLTKVNLSQNRQLDELRKKRNDLKKLIEEFDKNGIDVEQKRRQTVYWESLKEVDSLIRELLENLGHVKVAEDEKWSHYFEKEFVMYDDNETLLDHMLKLDILEYRRTHPADTRSDDELREELINKYQYTYQWTDDDGEVRTGIGIVSVFVRQVPRGSSINERRLSGKFFKDALIVKYSSLFSDVDPQSAMYNEHFDSNDAHLVQPNKEEFNNSKQWDLIENNKNIRKLYDALIELMNNNSAKLPTNTDFNYRLPQITGRRFTMLRRSGSLKELCDAAKYTFEQDWQLNERDDQDVNYEDELLKIRADGTRINSVPTRFIKPLKRPEFITGDVIGSVIAFTEMANNFVVKTQLSAELELMKQQLKDREDPNLAKLSGRQTTRNTIKLLLNMMDDLLYSNTTKLGYQETDFTPKLLFLIKFMTKFLHLGRILMLGYNLTSMSVGFFESFMRGNIEAMLGKDYTFRDLMHAYFNFVRYGLHTFLRAGSVKVTNKQIALMQHFGISKSLKDSYHGTERNRYIKLLSENINGMFGFTAGDYANSSFQLSMALSNVRFIDDKAVPKGFYTKLTLIRAIQKANPLVSYKDAKTQALRLYRKSNVTLEDAYEFDAKENIASVKPEYEQYVTKRIENRVTGKCYQRLAEALGVTPLQDTPGYALYVLLRPLGVLRNYMFTVIARNWNWAHDFQKRMLDSNGNILKQDDMLDGYLDIDAGNMNIGLHQGLYNWLKMSIKDLTNLRKKADSVDISDERREIYNYAVKKIALEILSVALLVGLSTLFKALAKGSDDDDWWYRFGYLTSVRLVNSFISVLDPTAFLEIIKNISTLISPLNDMVNLITLLSDMVGLSGHSPFDEILSGSYKGRSRLFRDLMRVTPFGNAYEDLSTPALKSRANWYIQQDQLTWSTIGGMYDLLWDAGK